MSIISCHHLSIGYEGKQIVKNINFDLEEKDYLLVIGENGSGKTTLIKTLLGLIKPLKGKIKFNNLKTNEIGYLPQINYAKKFFPASVLEVVMSGCLNNKKFLTFYTKKDIEIVNMNLKKFKIEGLKKRNFGELSGGQQQKVLLARAMCASSKVLVLDEPSTSLDKKSVTDLYNLINQINKEGTIIIMISHDLEKSLKDANKILEINEENIFFGAKEDYVGEIKCCH